jgi:hypothetical protein
MTTQILKENDFFRSNDLALAAALFLFCPLEAIDRENPRKAQFIFKRETGLDDLIANYWRGELKVDPAAYFNALRVIKSRLYSAD